MSVASTTMRNDYVGNGATAVYAYGFRVFNASELQVTVRNLTGSETTLTLTTDYTVSGVGLAAGGNVTLVNASQVWLTGGFLTTDWTLAIRRVMPLTQPTDVVNQGAFLPEIHEDQFDRAVMIAQQQEDDLGRKFGLPTTVAPADFSVELPAALVGETEVTLMTNATGDGFAVGPSAADVAYAVANAPAVVAAAELVQSASYGAGATTWSTLRVLTVADSPYSVVAGDDTTLFLVDASGGAVTLNLPAISGLPPGGISIGARKTDSSANVVTLVPNGADTIDGDSTIAAQFRTLAFEEDGVSVWNSMLLSAYDVLANTAHVRAFQMGVVSDLVRFVVLLHRYYDGTPLTEDEYCFGKVSVGNGLVGDYSATAEVHSVANEIAASATIHVNSYSTGAWGLGSGNFGPIRCTYNGVQYVALDGPSQGTESHLNGAVMFVGVLHSLAPSAGVVVPRADVAASIVALAHDTSGLREVRGATNFPEEVSSAGSPVLTVADLGVANLAASLDATTRLPTAQLPAAIPTANLANYGAANGPASLGATGLVPAAQLPVTHFQILETTTVIVVGGTASSTFTWPAPISGTNVPVITGDVIMFQVSATLETASDCVAQLRLDNALDAPIPAALAGLNRRIADAAGGVANSFSHSTVLTMAATGAFTATIRVFGAAGTINATNFPMVATVTRLSRT